MSRATQSPGGRYVPLAAVRELTVTSADGSRVHTEIYGPEKAPAVVLVHGWTCSTAFWAGVARELAADHRVIAYDQRGHGRSPVPGPGGYSTTALADDLEAVLAATLAPGERAVVAGHSMGGMTVMAAADRPFLTERAAAVLLCNTGSSKLVAESVVLPLRAGRIRTAIQRAVLASSAPLGPVNGISRKILQYATMGPRATREQVQACAEIVHACPRKVRSGWATKVLALLDLDAGLGGLTMPTAVITGTADRLTPPVLSQRIIDALPNSAGLTTLDGMGHMTPIEAPDAVCSVLRGLVRDHLAGDGAAGGRSATAETTASTAKATGDLVGEESA
ncbi:alpha/beta hydrolase [Streptomyces sp. S07_1.15]|uniref:alpha/beta fold hydrolase n=1 Tax=Streptomyces sp. S07_1.15 TaxID=2873925 RepID=UPI001D139C85|nr:alpha/beta hydrolase [Streptomyces sp. S07_1.15]MCC3653448.1 alpha/beta hydrolase [Streptomyces sp. S07_1.15]